MVSTEMVESKIVLGFPEDVAETAMLKSMTNNEEVLSLNGIYILDIGEEYYYSVVLNTHNSTEYYSAIFETISNDPDYVLYTNIVKNVVYTEIYEPTQYEIMGYTEVPEVENSNNYASGAVLTTSDADNVGTIGSSSDVDWWKIQFNYDGQANFWLGNIPTGCNYSLHVYNAAGTSLIQSSTNNGTNPELITFNVTKGTYYTVRVSSVSGYSTSSQYLLRIKNYPKFIGNKVYKIANAASPTKYLSVNQGYNANQQNVQLGTDYSEISDYYTNNVRMRLLYKSNVDAYLIGPICSFNGYGRTIDVYNTGTIVNEANVHTWQSQDAAHSVYANEQYYTFEECGNYVVIRMKYTTNYVLNANGTNVNILTYNETSNAQKWVITEDTTYNLMETQYKSYGWGWMYYSGNTATNKYFSSSYGKRFHEGKDDAHYALDIPATNGTTVYSATSGIVTQVAYKDGIEFFVVVETDDAVYGESNTNLRVLYQHMSTEPLVDMGDSVNQKTTEIGETGSNHMHFCVITDGGNRLEKEDFAFANNNTTWHSQYFWNTTNPLLFYRWDIYGFTYKMY